MKKGGLVNVKISKTHHLTKQGRIKRNPRTSRLEREFQKEKREHPGMSDVEIRQIVRDHEIARIKRKLDKTDTETIGKFSKKGWGYHPEAYHPKVGSRY